MKTLREIYFAAADLIDRRGLSKGRWGSLDGGLCMGAAVMISAFGKIVVLAAHNEVFKPLYTLRTFIQFNDNPNTTAADVSAKLRELAESLPGKPEPRQTDISQFVELLDRENKKQQTKVSDHQS